MAADAILQNEFECAGARYRIALFRGRVTSAECIVLTDTIGQNWGHSTYFEAKSRVETCLWLRSQGGVDYEVRTQAPTSAKLDHECAVLLCGEATGQATARLMHLQNLTSGHSWNILDLDELVASLNSTHSGKRWLVTGLGAMLGLLAAGGVRVGIELVSALLGLPAHGSAPQALIVVSQLAAFLLTVLVIRKVAGVQPPPVDEFQRQLIDHMKKTFEAGGMAIPEKLAKPPGLWPT